MPSSIAWIDLADEDRRQMLEVVSLFKERYTRDELGLASIRDTFADLLFPGTSTIQTRARYFLFVPWLYRGYEVRRVPSSNIESRLKRDEVNLIGALKAAGETVGIIGQVSGASLQRFPSSIYWNGLRRWGILRFPGSQDQYHRSLDYFYRRQTGHQRSDTADLIEDSATTNWGPNLPDTPGGFPHQAGFRLTPEEAEYLRERLLLSCNESLLAHLVDRCQPVGGIDFVWFHPQAAEFPPHLQRWVRHARNFSECLHGAALLYNLVLAELTDREQEINEYREWLVTWHDKLMARAASLVQWDRLDFWRLVTEHGQIPGPAQRFVSDWLRVLLDGDTIAEVVDHTEARRLVRDREIRLKRGRSRFESHRHLEMWSGRAGVAQLNYRWSPVARQISNDILHGLNSDAGGAHVESRSA
ncbi:MAG: DUF6361 family protein [Anaerolineae bacterium]